MLLQSKGNYKQDINTILLMGENNSKWNHQQKVSLQNMQAIHEAQYQRNKKPNQNMGGRPKQIVLQRRYIDGQQTQEKRLNTAYY